MDIYMGGGGDDVYIRLFVFSSEIEGCDICAWRWTVAVVIHPSHTHTHSPSHHPPQYRRLLPRHTLATTTKPPPTPHPRTRPTFRSQKQDTHTHIYHNIPSPYYCSFVPFFFPPPVVGWSEKQLTWFQNFVGKNEGRERETLLCTKTL